MFLTWVAGAAGAVAGFALGRHSGRILAPENPKGVNHFKYNMRSSFLRGLAQETHSFIISAIYMQDNSDSGETLQHSEAMEKSMKRLICYYEPMHRLYLADTGIDRICSDMIRSLRKAYASEDVEQIEEAIGHYANLASTVENSRTLIWI